jgi:hypothetical protein
VPIVALTVPVILPIAPMRAALGTALPLWKWRCGDEDGGGAQDRAALDRPQTIMGQGPGGIVMMTIEGQSAPLPLEAGAPPHQLHLRLSQPSIDDPEIAKRMAVVVCGALVAEQDRGAHCQISPGGKWYSAEEIVEGLTYCTSRETADRSIDEFLLMAGRAQPSAAPAGEGGPSPLEPRGVPAGSPAQRLLMSEVDHSFAKILTEVGGADFARQMGHTPPPDYASEEPQANRLPTFVLSLAQPIAFDWGQLRDIGQMDSKGSWQAHGRPDGSGTLTGRGCRVTIEARDDIVPRYMISNALARSFWFKTGPSVFLTQRCSLVVRCDLDTRAAPYEDVRETAMVMTLLLGLLTRTPGVIALLNNGVHTLLEPALVQEQVCHLHKNQIPVMLWTWTAPDSLVADSVSLTTGGIRPFLGYEIEVWNAPGEPQWVGDQLSNVINYLLHAGPVVKDGDSFGETGGDRSIRGFFGTTRAERHDTNVPVLLLEFDSPRGAVPRRAVAGGFGRKGL